MAFPKNTRAGPADAWPRDPRIDQLGGPINRLDSQFPNQTQAELRLILRLALNPPGARLVTALAFGRGVVTSARVLEARRTTGRHSRGFAAIAETVQRVLLRLEGTPSR
jgi:hypothetical protein